jgi:AraC-like DNA-binding protein
MDDTLLAAVSRYAERCADPAGVARTPIASLTIVRAMSPSELQYAISRPLACLVVQGAKHVAMSARSHDFGAGDSLLIAADVPTVSQVTRASRTTPYLSLVLDLDASMISGLSAEMKAAPADDLAPLRVERTDAEVADAALRLVRLLERPSAVPVLQAQLVREMHYWLLAGRHGAAIRRLGVTDSHAQRVGRAVSLLRAGFAQELRVDRLAAAAGMSASSFHQHFKSVTSLSPLQFQKQLRLIEARRLMMSEGASPTNAAYLVGYESVPHFTREYGRMFGRPPARDMKAQRGQSTTAA